MDQSDTVLPAAAPDGTQALARAAALLREIAGNNREGTRMADLAARLGLERPTAHRILQRLVDEGLAQQDPRDRLYRLGPLVFELGLAAAPHSALVDLCSDHLEALADASGDVVFLLAPSGRDSVCLDRREGTYPVKALMLSPGRRRPLGTGAGSLAMLGCYSADHAAALLRANARRLKAGGESEVDALIDAVGQARQQGFVMRETVEVPGISSLAVPVADAYGQPVCALSITTLRYRIESRIDTLLAALRKEAGSLGARWAKSAAVSKHRLSGAARAQSA